MEPASGGFTVVGHGHDSENGWVVLPRPARAETITNPLATLYPATPPPTPTRPSKKSIFFTATITLPPDPHNTMLKSSRTRAGAVTCLLDKLNIEYTGGEGVFAPTSVSL